MERIWRLTQKIVEYEAGNPKQLQHSLKVHSFAKLIAQSEGVNIRTLFILESAALLHDVGIKAANEKYGHCDEKLQEQEGLAPAQAMMEALEFEEDVIDRICYLVSHHHTYEHVEGIDYRILLEADLLVNLYEENASAERIQAALKKIFRTETGTWLCKTMFGIE